MTSNSCCLLLNFSVQVRSLTNYTSNNKNFPFLRLTNPSSLRLQPPPISAPQSKATSAAMEADQSTATNTNTSTSTSSSGSCPPMNLLFVEMGVGYDQHGQDITVAAMRACKDAISSNSIPAFRRGSIPGVTFDQMKLQINWESLILSSNPWILRGSSLSFLSVACYFGQCTGGFDLGTMRAFRELRYKARSCHVQRQIQQQQKFVCRSTPC